MKEIYPLSWERIKDIEKDGKLSEEELISYLFYKTPTSKEFMDTWREVCDLKKRLTNLETYVKGHMALKDAYQTTQTSKDSDGNVLAIFTPYEIEGKQIIFRDMGEI